MRLFIDLLDHTSDHLLGCVKIRYDTISEWTHGANVLVPLLIDLSRLRTHGDYLIIAPIEGDDARLVEDDLPILHYDRISCAEVYS